MQSLFHKKLKKRISETIIISINVYKNFGTMNSFCLKRVALLKLIPFTWTDKRKFTLNTT